MPRDTTAPIRKSLILSNDPAGWIHEGCIVPHEGTVRVHEGPFMSNDATAYVREGPIAPHEGTTPIRKSLILSNDATACVREGPIVSHEGTTPIRKSSFCRTTPRSACVKAPSCGTRARPGLLRFLAGHFLLLNKLSRK